VEHWENRIGTLNGSRCCAATPPPGRTIVALGVGFDHVFHVGDFGTKAR
jgi:hypothetical protein